MLCTPTYVHQQIDCGMDGWMHGWWIFIFQLNIFFLNILFFKKSVYMPQANNDVSSQLQCYVESIAAKIKKNR